MKININITIYTTEKYVTRKYIYTMIMWVMIYIIIHIYNVDKVCKKELRWSTNTNLIVL